MKNQNSSDIDMYLLHMYLHGQELFYKFISKITNKLVKQLLSMTVHSTTYRAQQKTGKL